MITINDNGPGSTRLLPYRLAIMAIFATMPLGCLALPDDNQQPINIQSDSATQKTLEGGETTEYFGNVVMTQGTLLINGDHIIIHSMDRKVTQITAIGKPAKFQQQSNPEKDPIKASADTINYQLKTETVILANNANIEQEGATVSGNRIEYNVASERVKAEQRVNMVFTPASVQPTQAESPVDSPIGNANSNDQLENHQPENYQPENKGSNVDTDSQ